MNKYISVYLSSNQGSRREGPALGQVGEEAVQRKGRLLGESFRGYSAGVLLRIRVQRKNAMLMYNHKNWIR